MSTSEAPTSRWPVHPAPWTLTGSGFVVALRAPAPGDPSDSFLPADLAASRAGRLAWLVFADYASSDCGPYRELLYIPGHCTFGARTCLTIGRIFVSTEVSVENGRRNWGIPKDCCTFDVDRTADGHVRVRLALAGRTFADLTFRAYGVSLPVTTALVPARFRTLAQRREGRRYVYVPKARGKARPAELLAGWTDPALFPAISKDRVLFAVAADSFAMDFPIATLDHAES